MCLNPKYISEINLEGIFNPTVRTKNIRIDDGIIKCFESIAMKNSFLRAWMSEERNAKWFREAFLRLTEKGIKTVYGLESQMNSAESKEATGFAVLLTSVQKTQAWRNLMGDQVIRLLRSG